MGKLLAALFILFVLGFHGVTEIYTNYQYRKTIQSYWDLGVKASTLNQKAVYLDEYVTALEASGLSGNNALVFKTPNNSYDQNMIVLQSLQTRMHEIQGMDVQSFQYQQAISQITAQEQGQADDMLATFRGIWFRSNHFFLWDWIDFVRWTIESIVCLFIGLVAASWTRIARDRASGQKK